MFQIDSTVGYYRLIVVGYSGDAGDAIDAAPNVLWRSYGMKFSTPGSDNDEYEFSCGDYWNGGWWYRSCSTSLLNRNDLAIWALNAEVGDVQSSQMLLRVK